jgi:hypothetical protein
MTMVDFINKILILFVIQTIHVKFRVSVFKSL